MASGENGMRLFDLTGKVALITGGNGGIGLAFGRGMAEAGAAIMVAGRNPEKNAAAVEALEGYGIEADAVIVDVRDQESCQAMVEATVARFGRLDILVCNAALRRQQPFLEIGLADWHRILSVPLDGAFLCARAAVPHMIEAGGGAIVTLGGLSAHIGTPGRAHVCAAKAGLVGLTHALAVELAPHGIRANCVAPGAIDTVRGASAGPRPGSMTMADVPAGRMGRPEEIAATVCHLCRPEAAYITGQTIHVNGGRFLA